MKGFGEPDTILNHCRGQAARPFHPIWSMVLVYLPTKLGDCSGKCWQIYQHHGSHMGMSKPFWFRASGTWHPGQRGPQTPVPFERWMKWSPQCTVSPVQGGRWELLSRVQHLVPWWQKVPKKLLSGRQFSHRFTCFGGAKLRLDFSWFFTWFWTKRHVFASLRGWRVVYQLFWLPEQDIRGSIPSRMLRVEKTFLNFLAWVRANRRIVAGKRCESVSLPKLWFCCGLEKFCNLSALFRTDQAWTWHSSTGSEYTVAASWPLAN